MKDNYKQTNSKGTTYFLNGQDVNLRGGRIQRIYYFSRDERKTATYMPDGKEVFERKDNGLLMLRNARKAGN